MDEYKRKVAPTGMWGRKERKMSKATARALKEEARKELEKAQAEKTKEEE